MRQSSFIRGEKPTDDFLFTPRVANALLAFNHYRLLPLNVLHQLADPKGDYGGFRNVCTDLWRRGLLDRLTFNGSRNRYETQTYSRTNCRKPDDENCSSCGRHFLLHNGHPSLTDYNNAADKEQVVIDLAHAFIELGARNSDVELHKWPDIAFHPKTPRLPDAPFRFYLDPNNKKENYITFDGLPFYLKRNGESTLFVTEIVRTNKKPQVIRTKLDFYKKLEKQIRERYGFSNLFVLWIATSQNDANNLLLRIKDEFPNGCKWHAVNWMDDPIKEQYSTIPITTALFDTPYQRFGHAPYSLKTLSEVA